VVWISIEMKNLKIWIDCQIFRLHLNLNWFFFFMIKWKTKSAKLLLGFQLKAWLRSISKNSTKFLKNSLSASLPAIKEIQWSNFYLKFKKARNPFNLSISWNSNASCIQVGDKKIDLHEFLEDFPENLIWVQAQGF
jgi:hypothetical protein